MNRKGIPYGMTIAMFMNAISITSFFVIGFLLVWKSELPSDLWGWLQIGLSSIIYLIGGAAFIVVIFLASIVVFFRDSYLRYIGVPILVTLAYSGIMFFLPFKIPGPIDEAIVFGISQWIRVAAVKSQESDEKELEELRRYKEIKEQENQKELK
jgi:hypothetical protein